MAYDGTLPKDLDITKPDGDTEYESILDDAIREIKKVFKYTQSVTTLTDSTTLDATHGFVFLSSTTVKNVTLPTASTIASSSATKEYRLKNINTATWTIVGSVLINGSVVTNPTLGQYDGIYIWTDGTTYFGENAAINSVSDGTNTIYTKIINIGDWNMDTTSQVDVAHGLTLTKIRQVTALIRNDTDTTYTPLTLGSISTAAEVNAWVAGCTSTNVNLQRKTAGAFDDTAYDSTSYNRGWITITYVA